MKMVVARLTSAATSIVLCINLQACGSGSASSTAASSNQPTSNEGALAESQHTPEWAAWTARLRPISQLDSAKYGKKIRAMKFQDPQDGTSKTVPWAYIEGNSCLQRARFTSFGLANINSSTLPVLQYPMTPAQGDQQVNNRDIDSAAITLVVPMHLKQKYKVNSREIEAQPIDWLTHHATVVNVGGELRVLDISYKSEAVSIKEWVAAYFKEDDVLRCSEITSDEGASLNTYWAMAFQGGFSLPQRPARPCGYFFHEAHSDVVDPNGSWGSVGFEFGETSYSMSADHQRMKELLLSRNLPATSASIRNATIQISPMSVSEYCAQRMDGLECAILGLAPQYE